MREDLPVLVETALIKRRASHKPHNSMTNSMHSRHIDKFSQVFAAGYSQITITFKCDRTLSTTEYSFITKRPCVVGGKNIDIEIQ